MLELVGAEADTHKHTAGISMNRNTSFNAYGVVEK